MALGHFQQTAMAKTAATILGNYQLIVAGTVGTAANAATSGMFVPATSASTFGSGCTILGIGALTGFTENLEFTTTQAANSKEPDKAVANHTLTITFELLEFYPPNWDIIRGSELDVENSATASTYLDAGSATVNTWSTGGLTAIGWKAYAFYNTKMIAGTTVETVIVVHKAKIETGHAFTPKTDHDTDPVMVIPFTLTAELDTAQTTLGTQLYYIETEIGAA